MLGIFSMAHIEKLNSLDFVPPTRTNREVQTILFSRVMLGIFSLSRVAYTILILFPPSFCWIACALPQGIGDRTVLALWRLVTAPSSLAFRLGGLCCPAPP